MERFCGSLGHANKNPHFPWASLDRHVLQIAQLAQLKLIYGLTDVLSLEDRHHNIATGTRYDDYPNLVFVYPMRTLVLHSSLQRKVAAYISAALDAPLRTVHEALQVRRFAIWGRMQQVLRNKGGDLIRGRALSRNVDGGSRDASYVKVGSDNTALGYINLCDLHQQYHTQLSRWNCTRPQLIDQTTFGYGCVEEYVIIDTGFLQEMSTHTENPARCLKPLVLAVISPIPTFKLHKDTNMVLYRLNSGRLAPPEIIDVKDVDCLVGRMCTPGGDRYLIERTSVIGRLNFLETLADPS